MSSARIMIVEDESIVAEDLRKRLANLGYEVPAIVSTGEEAIEVAKLTGPSVVLMDIVLGGVIDGVQAAEAILSQLDIPVVFITAHADDATLDRAKITGPFGYIIKPFREQELRSVIDIALFRHKMENEVKTLERWLRAIITSIGEAVVATDIDAKITYINPVAETLIGCNQQQVIGRDVTKVFTVVHPQTGEVLANPLLQTIGSGKTITLNKDIVLVAQKNNANVPIDQTSAPIRDENDNIIGGIMVFRDTTERQQAQEEKLRILRRLEKMQKLESLGTMASGMAHELNNFLTVILGNAQLAQLNSTPDSSLKFNLDQIEDFALRAGNLCKRMLELSAKKASQSQQLDLNQIADEIKGLLRHTEKKNITIQYNLAKNLPLIPGDPFQVRQMMLNLVNNAMEAIGDKNEGQIKISTGVMHASLTHLKDYYCSSKFSDGDYVFFEVQDDGIGMIAGTRTKIFDPFFTTKSEGYGLGMPIVLNIVQAHKGAIGVRSESGCGATITVLFPCNAESTLNSLTTVVAPSVWRATGTVLVVDDEEAVRKVAAKFLESFGFDIITAENGLDAVTYFSEKANNIDYVLLDLLMPKMDGEEALKEFRKIKPNVPVLLMSGYKVDDEIINRLSGGNQFGILQKPFTAKTLRTRMWELTRQTQ